MAWADTDDSGFGEFGGGYAGAPGGEGWAGEVRDLQRDIWDSVWAGQGRRSTFGLHPDQLDEYGNPRDQGGFLTALQQEMNQINQNVRNNNTIDAIAAHNQNIIGNRISNQGNRRGSRPNTGWMQSTQPIDTFNPGMVDLRDPTDVLDLGGGMAGSGAMSGSFTGMAPGTSDGGLMSEGGGEYLRKQRRIPNYGGYVDLYDDLIAAQPEGMSKADWGQRHWERHGGQEGRSFYGPSQINYPVGPDGMAKMKFITRPQPPSFTGLNPAYTNAYDQWESDL